MAEGSHPFPSRTRKLSPPAPMVLGTLVPGRVGRRRISPLWAGPSGSVQSSFSTRFAGPAHLAGTVRPLPQRPGVPRGCGIRSSGPSWAGPIEARSHAVGQHIWTRSRSVVAWRRLGLPRYRRSCRGRWWTSGAVRRLGCGPTWRWFDGTSGAVRWLGWDRWTPPEHCPRRLVPAWQPERPAVARDARCGVVTCRPVPAGRRSGHRSRVPPRGRAPTGT